MSPAPSPLRAIVQPVFRASKEASVRLAGPTSEVLVPIPLSPYPELLRAWRDLAPALSSKVHHKLLQDLRRARGQARHQPKEWYEVLPDDVVSWAWATLDAASRDMERDNTRVARLDNSPQMRRFKRQHRQGCCGSIEWKATGPDGKLYLLGFNYGH